MFVRICMICILKITKYNSKTRSDSLRTSLVSNHLSNKTKSYSATKQRRYTYKNIYTYKYILHIKQIYILYTYLYRYSSYGIMYTYL